MSKAYLGYWQRDDQLLFLGLYTSRKKAEEDVEEWAFEGSPTIKEKRGELKWAEDTFLSTDTENIWSLLPKSFPEDGRSLWTYLEYHFEEASLYHVIELELQE